MYADFISSARSKKVDSIKTLDFKKICLKVLKYDENFKNLE